MWKSKYGYKIEYEWDCGHRWSVWKKDWVGWSYISVHSEYDQALAVVRYYQKHTTRYFSH